MENQYFEDVSQPQASEEDIIKRIKDCEMIVDKLTTDETWKVITKDAARWVRELDGKWQDVADEKMLREMRILKIAYKHIFDLPKKYKDDLVMLKEMLKKQGEIQRDYEE